MNHNTEVWLHLLRVPWAYGSVPVRTCLQSSKAPPGFLTVIGLLARSGVSLGECTLSALVYFMWINFFSQRPFSNIAFFILWTPPGECLQVCFLCQRTEPNLKLPLALGSSVTLDELPRLWESQFFHQLHEEGIPVLLLSLPRQGLSKNQMRWFFPKTRK